MFVPTCHTDQEEEEYAIAVYWVSDGIDRCHVGFLPRHYMQHHEQFNGQLAQVVQILGESKNRYNRQRHYHNKGMCLCSIISTVGYNGVNENSYNY